jgi:hypothetical protein
MHPATDHTIASPTPFTCRQQNRNAEATTGRRRMSGRAALVLTVMALTVAPQIALAEDSERIEGTFSVLYTYPSAVNYCVAMGGNVSVEAQGIGNLSGLGPMFLTVKKCFTFSSAAYAGTFSMTAGNGDALSGTYAGLQGPNDESGFGSFQGTLTVTAGTGGFRHVRGRLLFTAVGGPNSVSETASAVNGMAFYLVEGKLAFPGRR